MLVSVGLATTQISSNMASSLPAHSTRAYESETGLAPLE